MPGLVNDRQARPVGDLDRVQQVLEDEGLTLERILLTHGHLDPAQLLASIRERLFPLRDDITFLPGHGPSSTFGEERCSNPYVADRLFWRLVIPARPGT